MQGGSVFCQGDRARHPAHRIPGTIAHPAGARAAQAARNPVMDPQDAGTTVSHPIRDRLHAIPHELRKRHLTSTDQ